MLFHVFIIDDAFMAFCNKAALINLRKDYTEFRMIFAVYV